MNKASNPLFFIHLEGRGLFLWKRGMYLILFDVYIFKELNLLDEDHSPSLGSGSNFLNLWSRYLKT
jgi:hypothetical protein